MSRAASALILVFLLAPWAPSLQGQEPGPVRFSILPNTGEAVVEGLGLFSDPDLIEAVRTGLPLRISIRVELWRDGFFDSQEGRYEWRATVVFDPLTRRYRIQTSQRTQAQVEVNTLEEAQEALQVTLAVPIRPEEAGRYYYMAVVQMETLSLSDLEELQRWLQGELVPVVEGERDVEGALAKGVRRLLVRLLGLPARRFQIQSPHFTVGPEGGREPGELQRLRDPPPVGQPVVTPSGSSAVPYGHRFDPPEPIPPTPVSKAPS